MELVVVELEEVEEHEKDLLDLMNRLTFVHGSTWRNDVLLLDRVCGWRKVNR